MRPINVRCVKVLIKQIFNWFNHCQKFKNVGQNKYDKGSILDPQSDTTYRFSVTVSPDGENLLRVAILVFLQLVETKHGTELNNS